MRLIQPLSASSLALLTAAALTVLGGCAVVGATTPSAAGNEALLSSLQVTPQDENVLMTMQVTNTLTTPLSLTFTSGQSAEFIVMRGSSEVWRWSADRAFTQAIRNETLDAGETLQLDATWPVPPDASGQFEAVGRLLANDLDVEQRTTFTLP